MSIALLYERSENDENGIKQTAQQLGIDLKFIPFRKIALAISKEGFSAKTKGKDYTKLSTKPKSCLTVPKAKTAAYKLHTLWRCLAKKP